MGVTNLLIAVCVRLVCQDHSRRFVAAPHVTWCCFLRRCF